MTTPRTPEGLIPQGRRFSPRPWLLRNIIRWFDGTERIFLLTGDSGTGKSVISQWIAEPPADDQPEDATGEIARLASAWDAVYFCSERYVGSSPDPRTFIREVGDQLRQTVPGFDDALQDLQRPLIQGRAEAETVTGHLVGVSINQLVVEGNTLEETYELALAKPLSMALQGPGARAALLLVDGLDEGLGEPTPSIVDLVAELARLPVPLRLFVTSKNDQAAIAGLLAIENAAIRHIDLSSPESKAEVDTDIKRFVTDNAEKARATEIRALGDAAMGNFLYVDAFLDELVTRRGASSERSSLPTGLARAYQYSLSRLLERIYGDSWRNEWSRGVAALFGVLAVLRRAVPVDAIAAWTETDEAELRMTIDQLQQVLQVEAGGVRVRHPALAAFLLSADLGQAGANPLHVDSDDANRRIVRHYLEAIGDPGGRGWAGCDDYGLAHLADHLADLYPHANSDEPHDLVNGILALTLDAGFRSELRARILDPIAIGRPYRSLVSLLLRLGHLDALEMLVDDLAGADEPAVRAVAFEALVGYAEADGSRAHKYISDLALGEDPIARLVALRATARLSPDDQALVFKRVVTRGDDATRMAAAYAMYVNWSTDPTRLTGEVLYRLADGISVLRFRQLVATLEFLASATITTYINNCSDAKVAHLTSRLWHHVLVHKLHVNVVNRPFLERTVIAPAMARHFSTRVLGAAIDFDRANASRLLPLRGEEAIAVRDVVDRLDPKADIAAVKDSLALLLDSEVVMFRILAGQVVAVHAVDDFSSARPVIDHLFESGSTRQRMTLLLAFTVLLPECPHAWVSPLERMTSALAHSDEGALAPGKDPLLEALGIFFVPLGLAYCRQGTRLMMHEQLIADGETSADVLDRCVTAVGVVGLYHPSVALAAFEPVVEADDSFLENRAVGALGLIRNLHPALVDLWLQEWGTQTVRDATLVAAELDAAHSYIEAIGLYTNGVHQAIHYPFMRSRLLMNVFKLMLEARSEQDWVRRYAAGVLRALREADYTLLRWTE